MSKKVKSKTVVDSKPKEPEILPYISLIVKEIGNLPNVFVGQTRYFLTISTTIEKAEIRPISNNPLYPCREKVTHKSNWEWQLYLPSLTDLSDFFKLSAEFIVIQITEEIEPPVNPADSTDMIAPRITELGTMVISLDNLFQNKGNITRTQIFYGEEEVPLKKTWTNSPFMKYFMKLNDIEVPIGFEENIFLEITFDSILNLPVNPDQNNFLLELSLPFCEDSSKTLLTKLESKAEQHVYKNFTRLAQFSERLKYSHIHVNDTKRLDEFSFPENLNIRENFEENTIFPQNTLQKILLTLPAISNICHQECLTLQLISTPNLNIKGEKKIIFNGKFNLNEFLESEIVNLKMAVPLSTLITSKTKKSVIERPVSDYEGFNSCVLLEFNLSAPVGKLPPVDPNIEINSKELARVTNICEKNISKLLKLKTIDFVQNYQKNYKIKYLRQADNLTNLKVFDNFYIYNEKDLLTAAVNYLSVNRSKYGDFRNKEVRKKCFIDLSDFTNEVVFKLDDRSPLPEPCTKELFELGYLEEANSIHIMVSVNYFYRSLRCFFIHFSQVRNTYHLHFLNQSNWCEMTPTCITLD